jgi:hypothetical protein
MLNKALRILLIDLIEPIEQVLFGSAQRVFSLIAVPAVRSITLGISVV